MALDVLKLQKLGAVTTKFWVEGVLYPFGLADLPTGREFISTICGKAAANGLRWGKIASAIIDRVAVFLGDDPDHCWRTYQKYDAIDN